jgi:hypothetical protein
VRRPEEQRPVTAEQRDRVALAQVQRAIEALEVPRLHRRHHDAAEAPVPAADAPAQADERGAERAADEPRTDVETGRRVVAVDAKVFAVGGADVRRPRVVRVLRGEAVDPDHVEIPDERQGHELPSQRVLEVGGVRAQGGRDDEGVGDPPEGQIDGLEGARRLLLQHLHQALRPHRLVLDDACALQAHDPEGERDHGEAQRPQEEAVTASERGEPIPGGRHPAFHPAPHGRSQYRVKNAASQPPPGRGRPATVRIAGRDP